MKIKIQDVTVFFICSYAMAAAASITLAEVFFVCALLTWGYEVFSSKKSFKEIFSSPITPAMAAFAAWHLIAALAGVDPAHSLFDYRKTYLLLMFFLAMNTVRDLKILKAAALFFTLGSGLIGLYAAITTIYFRYIKHMPDFRANSFSGNHMVAGGMLMLGTIAAAGIIAYLLKTEKKFTLWSGAAAVAFILSSLGLVFTFTRGSWIAAFAGVTIIAFVFDKRSLIVIGLALISVIFLAKNSDVVKRGSNTFKLDAKSSEMERVYMWRAGFKIIKDRPITGIGTANLEKVYPSYRVAEAAEPNAGHLHNNLIQIAVIDGLPGLAIYLWMFAAFWIALYKAFKKMDNDILKYAVITVFGANIAFFINGFFEYNLFSSQVALMFWFVMGVGFGAIRLYKAKNNE